MVGYSRRWGKVNGGVKSRWGKIGWGKKGAPKFQLFYGSVIANQ